MSHVVMMGDPAHFSVVGGANPHTRDRYGRKKSVDRALAIAQWQRMRDLLQAQGLQVVVLAPDPAHPGLVYPANAGFRNGDQFILSHLTPTRAGEQAHYRRTIEALGLPCHAIQNRFEGEADLFPAGEHYLFTWGTIRKQRFVARLGWPPWKRIYGFRSQPEAIDEIDAVRPLERPVLRVELRDERYYHGDTCLCSFGPGRRNLLAFLPGIAPESREALRRVFGERLIPLSRADAAIYAANSFAFDRASQSHLVMPQGVTPELEAAVRARHTEVLTVRVSEFYKKGGGSVKCMIGDLGELD